MNELAPIQVVRLPRRSKACEDSIKVVAEDGLRAWRDADVAAHEAELRSAARYICREPGEREDLIQDTFERALRFLSHGNPRPTNMRVWLISIMRNAFIDRKRRTAVAFEELGDSPAADPDPEPPWGAVSLDQVHAALGQLDRELQAVFELHYLAKQRYSEIARQLGIPANTVASRLFRARKALREILLQQLAREGAAK